MPADTTETVEKGRLLSPVQDCLNNFAQHCIGIICIKVVLNKNKKQLYFVRD